MNVKRWLEKREFWVELVGVGVVLLTSVFFRFWRLKELFVFTMDEAYEAYLIEKIVNLEHWPLIGVNAADTGIYLGPGILYLGAIPYWLAKGSPVGVAFSGSLIGVLTTVAVWWVARKWGGKLVGWLGGMMYASSWLVAMFDRRFWNPSLMPLLSVVIGYSLWRVIKGSRKYWILLGLGLGGVLHSHLSGVIFFPLVIGVLVWKLVWKRVKWDWKWTIAGVMAFLIMISPLLVFDIRHSGTNAKAVVSSAGEILKQVQNDESRERQPGYSTQLRQGYDGQASSNSNVGVLGRVVLTPGEHNLATEVVNCAGTIAKKAGSVVGLVILCLSLGVLIYRALIPGDGQLEKTNKRKPTPGVSKGLYLALVAIGMNWLLLTVSGRWVEYYWLPSFPWVVLLVGWGLGSIITYHGSRIRYQKILGLVVFGGLIIFNFYSLLGTENEFGLEKKEEVLAWVKEEIGDAAYQLESWGGCYRFEGWGYLARHYVGKPSRSYDDAFFEWIFENKNSESRIQNPEYLVSLVNVSKEEAEDVKEQLIGKSEELKEGAEVWRNFGGIEAIVTKLDGGRSKEEGGS
jgi:4-amino-4-deoxy-L-arabinose transferase-like glycosyltransferase